MKTSIIYSFIAFMAIALTNCSYAQEKTTETKRETREVSNFNGIKVQEGIALYLTMGSTEKVEIEAAPDVLEHVVTELDGTFLKVHMSKNIRNHKVKAYVSAKTIELLGASSGSSIETKTMVESEKLKIGSSSGASINAEIKADKVIGDASSGASIDLKGTVNQIKLDASSGSSIDAFELKSQEAIADASSGASIEITVEKSLSAEASSGGSVDYRGEPQLKDISKSSGGSVKRK